MLATSGNHPGSPPPPPNHENPKPQLTDGLALLYYNSISCPSTCSRKISKAGLFASAIRDTVCRYVFLL